MIDSKTPALALAIAIACNASFAQKPPTKTSSEVLKFSDVQWGALNPARGVLGPRAANLWGDRTGSGASGFLVKFDDGFKSPPHIHNITYRGVVIHGRVHNDEPEAKPMWMPTNSYWTQPAGEVHITAARGNSNVVYVEIQQGPYLVQPSDEANDNGERPLNVHASNIVWLDASTTTWIKADDTNANNSPKIAFLWGTPMGDQPIGTLVKLPAGFAGKLPERANIKDSLQRFDDLWESMRPRERNELVELLIQSIEYDGVAGTVDIHFHATGISTLGQSETTNAQE